MARLFKAYFIRISLLFYQLPLLSLISVTFVFSINCFLISKNGTVSCYLHIYLAPVNFYVILIFCVPQLCLTFIFIPIQYFKSYTAFASVGKENSNRNFPIRIQITLQASAFSQNLILARLCISVTLLIDFVLYVLYNCYSVFVKYVYPHF